MRQDTEPGTPSVKHETLSDPENASNAEVTCACVLQAVKGSIAVGVWPSGDVWESSVGASAMRRGALQQKGLARTARKHTCGAKWYT